MAHMHKAIPDREGVWIFGWTQCVTPDACAAKPARQEAHGGTVQVAFCTCGATRRTEANGTARNVGPWVEKEWNP